MGMFDCYEPNPVVPCPWCGSESVVWRGKDGPNALFVWRQGHRHPVDQPIAEESQIPPERLGEFVLPDEFALAGWCEYDHRTEATGRCEDGIWVTTEIDARYRRRAAEVYPVSRELSETWQSTNRHLARAWARLPAGAAIGQYLEYLDHNELELAMLELERAAQSSDPHPGFWFAMADAASEMGLHSAQARYQRFGSN